MIRVTNQNLEVARKKRRKREEIIEKQKTKARARKCQKARGGISLSNKEKKNDESNIEDKTNADQASDNKYPLQF